MGAAHKKGRMRPFFMADRIRRAVSADGTTALA
jgi:hypothetical protein